MNLDTIREFIVFSRYLNFSKAALQLNLAQPTLSSHIATMEKELGFKLVIREQPVRLTTAGKRFCTDAEKLLEAYEATVGKCRDIARAGEGTLTLEQPIRINGFGRAIDRLVLEFRKQHPEIDVRWRNHSDRSLGDSLRSGRVDAGFITNGNALASQGGEREPEGKLDVTPIDGIDLGPFYLWMHQSHPLAGSASIDIKQAGSCTYLIPSSINYSPLEEFAKAASEQLGESFTCAYWPGNYEECILNIAPDEVMLVSQEERAEPAYDMVENRLFCPLENADSVISPALVSEPGNGNPALATFKEFLAAR